MEEWSQEILVKKLYNIKYSTTSPRVKLILAGKKRNVLERRIKRGRFPIWDEAVVSSWIEETKVGLEYGVTDALLMLKDGDVV